MKTQLSLDKHEWRPSVLPGQIVLVSTYDDGGQPNIAPKSWISMAAFAGPMLVFGCNVTHGTYRNLQREGSFVVNVPDASLADVVWALPEHHGGDRIARSGLSIEPATRVNAPLVRECRAHLECVHGDTKHFGEEVMVFGRIVAVSIDRDCLSGTPPQQYFHLRPLFFLEDGTYGTLDTAHKVAVTPSTDLELFVVEVGEPPVAEDDRGALVRVHLAYLQSLRRAGVLLMSGAFSAGGMYFVNVASQAEAERISSEDPMVRAGALTTVRPWRRSL